MTDLAWHTTTVAGGVAHDGVGGSGAPVVFLHRWGLSDRAYAEALQPLIVAELRVHGPVQAADQHSLEADQP